MDAKVNNTEAQEQNPKRGPGAAVYDEKLRPLIDQIVAICDENKMPVVVMVELDENEEGANRAGTIHGSFNRADSLAFHLLGIN